MTIEVQYEVGNFIKFKATRKFYLGFMREDERPFLDKDEIVQFDGSTLIIGGRRYDVPRFRGAVRDGLVVPLGVKRAADVRPRAANMSVRAANGQGESRFVLTDIADEERDLGTIAGIREAGRTFKKAKQDAVDVNSPSYIKAMQEIQKRSTIPTRNPRRFTGAYETGETLEELIPEALSTGALYPAPHVSPSARTANRPEPAYPHGYQEHPRHNTYEGAPAQSRPSDAAPMQHVSPASAAEPEDSVGFFED